MHLSRWFCCCIFILSLGAASAVAEESVIWRGPFTIPAGKYWVRAFTIQEPLINGRLAGNYAAQGGSGNDIEFLLFEAEEYKAFANGRSAKAIHSSGRRRSEVISIPLSDPGSYVLVFSNKFSFISNKQVQVDLRLVSEGVDRERQQGLSDLKKERKERIASILARLVTALGEKERAWGTKQIQGRIRIGFSPDKAINAYAYTQHGIIILNRGMIEYAESVPTMTDDILAGVMAHELAHIYYRHSRGNSKGQIAETVVAGAGAAYVINPLVGILAGAVAYDKKQRYDRMEESEADLLGIRLLCGSSFDPVGYLVLMQKLAEGSLGFDFLNTHPAPENREKRLRAEAQKCLAGDSDENGKPDIKPDTSIPQVVYSPAPEYTPEAKKYRIEGIVLLECMVDIDGRAKECKVIKGLEYGLNNSGIETVQNLWRFAPAKIADQPVRIRATVEIKFILN